MSVEIPSFLPFAVIGANVAVGMVVLFGLFLTRSRIELAARAERRAIDMIFVILIAWFTLAFFLARAEVFRTVPDGSIWPNISFGITLPILIGGAFILFSKIFGRILDIVPQHWLVGIQFYRILGVIFLVAYAEGLLPGIFALPAGYGDILVGLLAPAAAYLYLRMGRAAWGYVLGWNVLGIADLVMAVTLGLLSSPGRFQMLSFDAPNQFASAYPLVMIPVFAVPLSILLHMASLRKLSRDRPAEPRMVNP